MKKTLLFSFMFLFSVIAFTQTDSTKKSPWQVTSIAGLNANQVSLSNWTQGGDNSVAWTLLGNLSADYQKDAWSVKNNLKIAYGQTKLGSSDFRTNDNELYLEDVLLYNVGWKANPFFSNSFRTVIAKGYDYSVTPEIQTSDFFDPGYLTQSLGFEYVAAPIFSSRLGVALQEIFTNKFTNYSDDLSTKDKIEKFKLESGIESVTEGTIGVAENMNFNSKLRLFGRFTSLDVWDVRWDNTLTAKINKYFNVNLNVLLIYQKDQSVKTQVKQALQLGVTYSIF
jgi:hypothetical protein